MNKTRNSTIELLRIVAMFFIIVSHYSVHGGVDKIAVLHSNFLNGFILQITCLGNLGVDIFIMITGYFMISQTFNTNKFMKLLAQVWTYSVGIYICYVVFSHNPFSIKEFIKVLFPTTFVQYWFFTDYIVLYILSPFINIGIKSLGRNGHLKLLILTLTLWSIAPTFTTGSFYGSELPQFVMFYAIGAYLRLYPECRLNNIKNARLLALVSGALLLLSALSMDVLGFRYYIFMDHATWFFSRTSVLVIALSTGMLMLAVNHNPWSSTMLNKIASCTFGIYLIHDNNYVRRYIWTKLFKTVEWSTSAIMPLHLLAAVFSTFIICAILEYIRRITLERLYDKTLQRLSLYIDKKIELLFCTLLKKNC